MRVIESFANGPVYPRVAWAVCEWPGHSVRGLLNELTEPFGSKIYETTDFPPKGPVGPFIFMI